MAGTGTRLGQGSADILGAETSGSVTTTASTTSWITFSSVWMPGWSLCDAEVGFKVKTLGPKTVKKKDTFEIDYITPTCTFMDGSHALTIGWDR